MVFIERQERGEGVVLGLAIWASVLRIASLSQMGGGEEEGDGKGVFAHLDFLHAISLEAELPRMILKRDIT